MLFCRQTLDLIKKGKVKLAYRRWKRPSIKKGGTLLTPVGQLAIKDLRQIEEKAVTDREARLAGYSNVADLYKDLDRYRTGTLYRIDFELLGDDPRIALRNDPNLSQNDFDMIDKKLRRFDRASRFGPWTDKVLDILDTNPERRAGDLADILGFEKAWFKTQVRKLKALGLTISMGVGYRISPRGKAFINHKRNTV